MSFNKIILVGNLGRDPELRYTPQGTPVATFNIATNEKRKGKEGDQNITTWFRCVAWGRLAETVSQYLVKGQQTYVEGRLKLEEWQDREGKQRYTLEVNVSSIQFLGGGSGQAKDEYESADRELASRNRREPPEPDLSDDDIPF